MGKDSEHSNKEIIADKHKYTVKHPPEPYELSGNGKDSKDLGNGRWKHQGKTYKEEPLGKN